MGDKVVYEPKIGRYVVQEFVPEPTLGNAEDGWWSDVEAYSDPARAIHQAGLLQDNLPVPMYRVIDRGTDETK